MEVRTGTLEGFTAQDLFNLMNDNIYDESMSGRHNVIRDFHPPTLMMKREPSKIDDAVVNIIIWGRWQFYKWAYVSLVSALTHTDIGKFKIRIIIRNDYEARNKEEAARALFEPLGVEVLFEHFVDRKNLILRQQERYQMVLDADSMLIGNEYPIFNNLYNILKADTGFYCASPDDLWIAGDRIELNPIGDSNVSDYWIEEENLGFSAESLNDALIANENKWTWNILYGLDRNLFDTEKWRNHLVNTHRIGWEDEEGAIQLYLWNEGIKIEFIRDLFNIEVPTIDSFDTVLKSYISGEHEFSIYHPFNGGYTLSREDMISLLNKIFENANKKMDFCYGPLLV